MNSDLINSKVASSLIFFVYFQPMECTRIILIILLREKVSNHIMSLRLRSRGIWHVCSSFVAFWPTYPWNVSTAMQIFYIMSVGCAISHLYFWASVGTVCEVSCYLDNMVCWFTLVAPAHVVWYYVYTCTCWSTSWTIKVCLFAKQTHHKTMMCCYILALVYRLRELCSCSSLDKNMFAICIICSYQHR